MAAATSVCASRISTSKASRASTSWTRISSSPRGPAAAARINATVKLEDSLNRGDLQRGQRPDGSRHVRLHGGLDRQLRSGRGLDVPHRRSLGSDRGFRGVEKSSDLGTDDDLAFIIEDVSGVRKALSFEGGAAAELVLIFPEDTILG